MKLLFLCFNLTTFNKYRNFLFFLFGVLLFLLVSCAPKAVRKYRKHRDISLAKVQIKKTFVVGLEDDFPPFAFKDPDSGELCGYDIDTMKAMEKYLGGIKVIFKHINWTQKEELLKNEEIDCIWSGFSYTKDRSMHFELSKPYLRTCKIIIVRNDSPFYNFSDIKKCTIGIQSGSSVVEDMLEVRKQYKDFENIVFYNNVAEAVKGLDSNEYAGIVSDLFVFNNLSFLTRNSYRVLDEAISSDTYVIAFKKGNIKLKEKIEKILELMAYNDEISSISKKWFGANISTIGRFNFGN